MNKHVRNQTPWLKQQGSKVRWQFKPTDESIGEVGLEQESDQLKQNEEDEHTRVHINQLHQQVSVPELMLYVINYGHQNRVGCFCQYLSRMYPKSIPPK